MLLPTVIFSGGHKCDVFMISTIAYRPATCKQGIMISVSRPGSIAAICVWFGSTPRSGSAEITGVLWPQKCVFSSIHPSVRPVHELCYSSRCFSVCGRGMVSIQLANIRNTQMKKNTKEEPSLPGTKRSTRKITSLVGSGYRGLTVMVRVRLSG